MKNVRYVVIVIILSFFIVGCTDTDDQKKEIATLTEDELYDIYYLKEAPDATGNHDLSRINVQ